MSANEVFPGYTEFKYVQFSPLRKLGTTHAQAPPPSMSHSSERAQPGHV